MQPNLSSDLISYDISPDERVIGSVLSYLQEAVLQNMRVEIVQQIAAQTPEGDRAAYFEQKAYLQGQLSILTHLLSASRVAQQSTVSPSDSN